jgi:hypothetical protein
MEGLDRKLYLVHCGFYDPAIGDGVYEFHTNFFVVAETFEQARALAKQLPLYQQKKMHIDGLQELEAIDGFRILLEKDEQLKGTTRIQNAKYRSLAPSQTDSLRPMSTEGVNEHPGPSNAST